MPPRDFVDGLHQPRSAAQGIAARFHRGRAGMRILPRPDAVIPAQPQRAGHYADDLVLALEDRALFDVGLEIRVERTPADGCFPGIADAFERLAERNAVDIALLMQVLEREHTRKRAGSAHHRDKPAAL